MSQRLRTGRKKKANLRAPGVGERGEAPGNRGAVVGLAEGTRGRGVETARAPEERVANSGRTTQYTDRDAQAREEEAHEQVQRQQPVAGDFCTKSLRAEPFRVVPEPSNPTAGDKNRTDDAQRDRAQVSQRADQVKKAEATPGASLRETGTDPEAHSETTREAVIPPERAILWRDSPPDSEPSLFRLKNTRR